MRQFLKSTAIIGGLTLTLGSTSAFAGNCGFGAAGPNCQPSVVTHSGDAPVTDPMNVYSSRPMGHLRSVQYLGTPSVNITRIHGQTNSIGLSDAPSSFTGGCNPESTQYCRQGAAAQQPMPYVAPTPMYTRPAPVIAQPAPVADRVVYVGGGYDPSKFIPRTYGSNELTPGIAHIPTSIVDRSYDNAMAALNGGRAQPQPIASGGIVPQIAQNIVIPPTMAPSGNYMGSVSQTVTMAPQTNVYPGSMSNDGTYYEKVSGPTMLGGYQATQIICKREAPRMTVQRPVYGVPTPVPTPMMTPTCFNANNGARVMHSGRYGSYNR